jgi:phosphoglucosamine mutase
MKTTREFFGTDGIRGKVGEGILTPEFALELGRAAGTVFNSKQGILIARDPRVSSEMLQAALSSGISCMGTDVCDIGILPTPACAYLTKFLEAKAGVVISASHNPYYDNGIKFFNSNGNKLSDALELSLENVVLTNRQTNTKISPNKIGRLTTNLDAYKYYVDHCINLVKELDFGCNLLDKIKNLKVIIDCSNGATYKVAPQVFNALGMSIEVINAEPNGLNINQECGAANSTGLEFLAKKVKAKKADIGIAFDGDGDRVIFVSAKGNIIDGDHILYILTNDRLENNQVIKGVVGTQMSNLGLEQALLSKGIQFERANVGDRYVLELLLEREWILGGETSGHILSLDKSTTGDGLVTALLIISVMARTGRTLDDLVKGLHKYPQILMNVNIRDAEPDLLENKNIQNSINEVAAKLSDKGRILVRKSGTEPLLRVMLEGENLHNIQSLASKLTDVIQGEIKH